MLRGLHDEPWCEHHHRPVLRQQRPLQPVAGWSLKSCCSGSCSIVDRTGRPHPTPSERVSISVHLLQRWWWGCSPLRRGISDLQTSFRNTIGSCRSCSFLFFSLQSSFHWFFFRFVSVFVPLQLWPHKRRPRAFWPGPFPFFFLLLLRSSLRRFFCSLSAVASHYARPQPPLSDFDSSKMASSLSLSLSLCLSLPLSPHPTFPPLSAPIPLSYFSSFPSLQRPRWLQKSANRIGFGTALCHFT